MFQTAQDWINNVGMLAVELHDRISMGYSRAFYNATDDFEHEVHKGEIIFVMRDKYMPNKSFQRTG